MTGGTAARPPRRTRVGGVSTSPAAQGCPFCARIEAGSVALTSRFASAFPDGFPLNPGHTLVVPRRHIADFFELDDEEQADVWHLVATVRRTLSQHEAPAGFNIGINVGAAAGQTVGHAHVHVIPRYAGDVEDPRGGVRWVVPARAAYWSPP